MELYIYAFTETGRTLADKIQKNLPGASVFLYRKKEDLHLLEQIWSKSGLRGVLFVGAVGIAVRLIAPLVKNKLTDPAVLVMDERALHVIPILSGHYGGANELALQLAKITGAEPVITTATDIQGRFAVDVFARKNGLAIFPKEHIKVISGAILRGEPVGFTTEIPVQGQVPEGLRYYKRFGTTDDSGKKPDEACGIYLGESQESPYACTLQLLPRNLIAGLPPGKKRYRTGGIFDKRLRNPGDDTQ